MSNIIKELYQKQLTDLDGNRWIPDNVTYITIMGSTAYGASSDVSDVDIYSFGIPRREDLFPHLRGEIVGFGNAVDGYKRFKNFQQHHIKDLVAEKEYDINFCNIVDFFQFLVKNNPNMIDSIFTPDNCVMHATRVGQMVRENRKMFLHRGSWHTFKEYAYSELKAAKPVHKAFCAKCEIFPKKYKNGICGVCKSPVALKQVNNKTGKRRESVDVMGYDPKNIYHVVRLLNEVEQILTEGDIDLQRNKEQLKSIRRGEWTLEQVENYFAAKVLQLEAVFNENKIGLPWGPFDTGIQDKAKQLLFQCLEEHYGSLDKCVVNPDAAVMALREVNEVLSKHRNLL